MFNKYMTRSLQSLVVLPILTANFALVPVTPASVPTGVVVLNEKNGNLENAPVDNQQQIRALQTAKINAYFTKRKLHKAAAQAEEFVKAGEKYGIDPYTIVAFAMAESTGGKFACYNDEHNWFGWDSCGGVKFSSPAEAIDTVARNFSGNNPKTARYYANQTLDYKLDKYNPPSANPRYKSIIKGIIKTINATEVTSTEVAVR